MAKTRISALPFPNQCCRHPDACSCEMAKKAPHIEIDEINGGPWDYYTIDADGRRIALSFPPSKKEGER